MGKREWCLSDEDENNVTTERKHNAFSLAHPSTHFIRKGCCAIPCEKNSSGHMQLVIMEGTVIGWHRKWPLTTRPDTGYQNSQLISSLEASFKNILRN